MNACRWKAGCARSAIPPLRPDPMVDPRMWNLALCFEHWCEMENYDPVTKHYRRDRPEEVVIILPGEDPIDLREVPSHGFLEQFRQ